MKRPRCTHVNVRGKVEGNRGRPVSTPPSTHLVDQPRAKEDVEEGEPEEGGECREESAAQVQVLAARGKQGRQGEAAKHYAGAEECLHHLEQRGIKKLINPIQS